MHALTIYTVHAPYGVHTVVNTIGPLLPLYAYGISLYPYIPVGDTETGRGKTSYIYTYGGRCIGRAVVTVLRGLSAGIKVRTYHPYCGHRYGACGQIVNGIMDGWGVGVSILDLLSCPNTTPYQSSRHSTVCTSTVHVATCLPAYIHTCIHIYICKYIHTSVNPRTKPTHRHERPQFGNSSSRLFHGQQHPTTVCTVHVQYVLPYISTYLPTYIHTYPSI